MRKVVVYELLSSTASPRVRISSSTGTTHCTPTLAAVIATQDAVILGRRSYDEWAPYSPASDIQPFADFINGVMKYVATSTPPGRECANATVIDSDLVAFVRDLKDRPGDDIGVHASISVAQSIARRRPR